MRRSSRRTIKKHKQLSNEMIAVLNYLVRRESNETFLQKDYKEAWWDYNRSQGLVDTRSDTGCKRLANESELSPQSKANQGYYASMHSATRLSYFV